MVRILIGAALALVCAQTVQAQTLEPARLPGMCVTIDPHEGSVSRPCDKSSSQSFVLPARDAPGPIRYGEACLAPRDDGNYPQLVPQACDAAPAQTWTISAEGHVRNGAGRCLSLLGLSSRTGERVYGGHCPNHGDPHEWVAKSLDQEIYDQVRGRLRWRGDASLCLSWVEQGSFIGLAACNENNALNQVFSFDRHDPGQFRARSSCLTSNQITGLVRLADCYVSPDKTWMLQDGSLLSDGHGLCLEARMEGERWVSRMRACAVIPEQSWDFVAAP